MSARLYGLRVRLLRRAERHADGLAWALECGYPRGERRGYDEARIIARYPSQAEASRALCEMIRRPQETP